MDAGQTNCVYCEWHLIQTRTAGHVRTLDRPAANREVTMQRMLQALTDRLAAQRPRFPWEVRWPDGSVSRYGDGLPKARLVFRNNRVCRAVLTSGSLGFGEGYMDGSIEIEGSLAEIIRFAFADPFRDQAPSLLQRITQRLFQLRTRNTQSGSRKNVAHHYDLGNDFFRLWLDAEMTYSCAYFDRPDITLEQAQRAKHEHICRKLSLEPGMTLLDIGCGWGALARHAAREHGAIVHGITLSKNQAKAAAELADAAGLGDKITIEYRDYRDIEGQYDRVASVGMFEHVGPENYPVFFDRWAKLLKPGGVSVLHTIGKDVITPPDPWTMKYIFPGGRLPALKQILDTSAPHDLMPIDIENLRLHYALTLEEWERRFEAHLDEIRGMYDERFVRMWRFFLVSSAVGFRYGDLRLWQATLTNGINNDLPMTREHLYEAPAPHAVVQEV